MVEITIVVLIIGLLAGMGVPSFLRARTDSQKNLCISNLRVIDGAKEQWALISHRIQGAAVNEDEVDTLVRNGMPQCPAGGRYTYGVVGEAPACSLAEEQQHVLPWASSPGQSGEETEEEEGDNKKGGKGKGKGKGRGKGRGRDK